MDILGGGLVGRPAQEIGKLFDVADILVVRLGAEPADRHVLDQSPAYRADGLLGHWGAPVLGAVYSPSISRQDACFCYSPRPFPCHKLPRERFSPTAQPGRSPRIGEGRQSTPDAVIHWVTPSSNASTRCLSPIASYATPRSSVAKTSSLTRIAASAAGFTPIWPGPNCALLSKAHAWRRHHSGLS